MNINTNWNMDPDDLKPLPFNQLAYPNKFGNLARFTSPDGNYYDYESEVYRLADGSESTLDIAFPITIWKGKRGRNFIDHLNGWEYQIGEIEKA